MDYYCPKYFSKKAIIDKMTAFFFTCLLRRYAPSFTMFAERTRFELVIPFRGIHAFQACLFSHSSTSPIIAALTADYKGSYFSLKVQKSGFGFHHRKTGSAIKKHIVRLLSYECECLVSLTICSIIDSLSDSAIFVTDSYIELRDGKQVAGITE